jgi:hypothetical protein
MTPYSSDPTPVKLNCSVTLPRNAVVTRQVVFEGTASSGSTLDCSGGQLAGTAAKGDKEAVVVRSRRTGDSWSRPSNITVRNCAIAGTVRIYGLGRNGQAEAVKQSSMNANHTSYAQASAPTNIAFSNIRLTSNGGVPFYVSPGVTRVSLTNSTLQGTTTSSVIYLDAESSGAKITGNTFNVTTKGREVIAIDGSAHNDIESNKFNASAGGIFAYRNCGEGGTIRHQAPEFNKIARNTFNMSGSRGPAVWLNSRNGNRSFCFKDPSHPYGSSLSSMDMAKNNTVEGNTVIGGKGDTIRNDDPTNRVVNNRD